MILDSNIYGLVLSGGKSTRMGQDKGLIHYHGVPQREYIYGLLDAICDQTYLSIRANQDAGASAYSVIVDQDQYKGPYNGILSAHNTHPNVAWLVLACDLPLLDTNALAYLIAQRDPKKMATAYAHPDNPLAEPLCAIWEPHALAASISYLENGNGSCPRKFLIHNDVKLVLPQDPSVLLNANSETEYEQALLQLKK